MESMGVFVGGALSRCLLMNRKIQFKREFVFDCRDLVRSGVLPVQFPSEKPGEMFCRGCRKYRNCFYLYCFLSGKLVIQTGDITWLSFFLLCTGDGCLTICHRIMLHENLGEAHRKHAYQLMANELNMSHPVVSLVYMVLQLAVSFGHGVCVTGSGACSLGLFGNSDRFVGCGLSLVHEEYYHLHERYLESLKKGKVVVE